WFDFYSDEKHAGGVTKNAPTSENHIPIFIRGGAIIPLAELVQTTDHYSLDKFELHFYFDPSVTSSTGKIYNDDGMTPEAYEKVMYELLCFGSKLQEKRLSISLENKKGTQTKAVNRSVRLVVHNIISKPKNISINGKKQRFDWNKKENLLEIDVLWEKETSNYINIEFAK